MRGCVLAVLLALAAAAPAQERDRGAALERAYAELVAAHDSVQRAEAAREKGIEPLAGERLGIASGGSRLAPGYWDRQKQLEDDVTAARRRLDEALARWNALR